MHRYVTIPIYYLAIGGGVIYIDLFVSETMENYALVYYATLPFLAFPMVQDIKAMFPSLSCLQPA